MRRVRPTFPDPDFVLVVEVRRRKALYLGLFSKVTERFLGDPYDFFLSFGGLWELLRYLSLIREGTPAVWNMTPQVCPKVKNSTECRAHLGGAHLRTYAL